MLAERLHAFGEIQAACERIRSTPAPFTYTLLLHRTAWLFCLLAPLGLVASLRVWTPVVMAVLAYAFFGLDAVGDELEEPFGERQNSLPLNALVQTIEVATLEAIGAEDLPAPLQPARYILL